MLKELQKFADDMNTLGVKGNIILKSNDIFRTLGKEANSVSGQTVPLNAPFYEVRGKNKTLDIYKEN